MAQREVRKILRIGILQNGKIIEERLLRRRESVTIGQSSRNTFVLPVNALPKTFMLFELRGGVYHLNFQGAMGGRVSVDSSVLDFDALRGQNLAKQRGDGHSLALSEKSRGKVTIDDVTVLFQFVTPPPPARLQLPASVRGGLVRGMDWPFVSTLTGSAMVQIFAMVFITSQDYPDEPKAIEDLPDRFVEMVVKKKVEPPKTDVAKDDGKDGDDKDEPVKKEPEKTPEKVAQDKEPGDDQDLTPEQEARQEAKRRREVAKKVQNKTILKFIGTTGGDGEGTIVDSLRGGAADVAMKDAFDGASGAMVADSANSARDTRRQVGGDAGKVAGIDKDDLRAKGRGSVETGNKGSEVAVKGSVKIKRPSETFGTGVLDSEEIAKVVRRRKTAIKSCYERQLKRNPKLQGAVKVQFTIQESGRVGTATVLQNTTGDSALGTCITNNIQRWRFRKPDGGSVTVAYPFVFAPSS
ncbi:MAG: TonB family protein [Myxococcales bacterium]|nr:TonB family protein [Myxococcales bacterium]MCB9525000.1 TonB family protein [Myxococcales bacterium]